MLIVFSMLTSCFCFKAAAAEIDIYETESNNTRETADVTEDLADNLGRISSASDVDYYKITFDRGGITNFWLGDIPSGCDYQMQIYKGSTLVKTINNNSTGTSEFAQYNTLANTVYYIKISSNSGYNASSYYLFSMRRNNLGEARFFTYNCNGLNTRPAATNSMTHIWKTGYSGQEYLNNGLTPVYNSLTQCNVMVIDSHGGPGIIDCSSSSSNTTYLYASSTNSQTIENLPSASMANMRLLIFCGCNTGNTSAVYDNLVDMALYKGAKFAIGWTETINTSASDIWLGKLFEYCSQGKTINNAAKLADDWIEEQGIVPGIPITKRYIGSSNTSLTIN